MEELYITKYANGTKFKLKNRRVLVGEAEKDGDLIIQLKILSDKENADIPRARHQCYKGLITKTTFKVTAESAYCIMMGIQRELLRLGHLQIK